MNPFTRHPRRQGVTYLQHGRFAMGIAGRLLKSVAAFVMHSVFPFVSIPRELDLESTAAFILERNHWIETAGMSSTENRFCGQPAERLRDSVDDLPIEFEGFRERRLTHRDSPANAEEQVEGVVSCVIG